MHPSPETKVADPERWIDEHGDYLFRFALLRVSRRETAEDLVQETFLAALKAATTFAGRSSERTWLTGILNNKLIDRSRREGRVQPATDLGGDECFDALYDRTGHWKKPPGDWGADPAELLQRREFWDAFERCRAGLPDRLREALTLRLIDDLAPDVVCSTLDISPANLWTMLHRARVRLWSCMDSQGLGRSLTNEGSSTRGKP